MKFSILIACVIAVGCIEQQSAPVVSAIAYGPPSPYERFVEPLSNPLHPMRCPEQWIEQSPPLTRACVRVNLDKKS